MDADLYAYEIFYADGGWFWRFLSADEADSDGPYRTSGRAERVAESVASEARFGW